MVQDCRQSTRIGATRQIASNPVDCLVIHRIAGNLMDCPNPGGLQCNLVDSSCNPVDCSSKRAFLIVPLWFAIGAV
jgi:hypothetical protein